MTTMSQKLALATAALIRIEKLVKSPAPGSDEADEHLDAIEAVCEDILATLLMRETQAPDGAGDQIRKPASKADFLDPA